MSGKSYLESFTPTGHLVITKRYPDGGEEVVLDDHNMITIGMGVNLALLFGHETDAHSIDRHQFGYFQLGGGTQTASSIVTLHTPLLRSEYGATDLELHDHNKVDTGGSTTAQTFVKFDSSMITKPALDQVQFIIDLDTDTANGEALTEIGLFATDPFNQGATTNVLGSLLCAYRTFTSITKSAAFALNFKWTIEF